MNLQSVVEELEKERDRIDRAIAALAEITRNGTGSTRKSRPRATTRAFARRPRATRSHLTAAGRKRLSQLMKQRWAERRRKTSSGRKAGAKAA